MRFCILCYFRFARRRLLLECAAAGLMIASCLALMVSLVTYESILRVDRRPPVIWGEILGILGFIVHCVAMCPGFIGQGADGEDGRENENRL